MLIDCLLLEQSEICDIFLCWMVYCFMLLSSKTPSPCFFGVPPTDYYTDSLSSIDSSSKLILIRSLVMKLEGRGRQTV